MVSRSHAGYLEAQNIDDAKPTGDEFVTALELPSDPHLQTPPP